MRIRSHVLSVVFMVALAVSLAGCGDENNNDNNDNGDVTHPTPTPVTVRTATPTVTATPLPDTLPTETSTADVPTATPSATSTPVAGGCHAGDQITVTESLSKPYAGALVDLHYPGSVNIPGTGSDQSVADRVHFTANGIPATNDTDTNSDSVDDTLSASFVSITDNAAGTYVTVTFDCVEGQAPPAAGDFTCTVTSASSAEGRPITDEQCTLAVTGP